MTTKPLNFTQFPKPCFPSKTLIPKHFYKTKLWSKPIPKLIIPHKKLKIRACSISTSSSNSIATSKDEEQDKESARLFEKLKDAERERINKLEELDRKANLQLERQIVMASEWSRALLTLRGKLKGTEWDPETSHKIDFSDFWRFLNSNNVQFLEYSNYGQSVSVILPYYKDGKVDENDRNPKKEIVFKRHVVDKMPINC